MAMRETVRSLRVYFIVIGIIGGASTSDLGSLANFRENVVGAGFAIIGLGFALAYLFVGVFLRRLLVQSVGTINVVLYASLAYLVLSSLFELLSGLSIAHTSLRTAADEAGGGFSAATIVYLAVGLGIIWYLLRNVKRLSQEERSSAQVMDAGAP